MSEIPEKMSNLLPENEHGGYWRSLKELTDSPEIRKLLHEQDRGDSSQPGGMPRRNFLSLMGASLALAGLSGCRRPVEKIIPYVIKPEEIIPGQPQYYATSMPMGSEVYHLLAESHEGRPTRVSGNSLVKTTAGSADVWAMASILNLYDPDRSQKYRKQGEPSTLQEFVDAWTLLYKGFIESDGEGLAVLSESYSSPTLSRLVAEFRRRFSRAQWITYEPVSDENIIQGIEIALGESLSPIFDFRQAQVILSLDADFLGTESRRHINARGFADSRRMTSEQGSMNRLYLVESTLSQTTVMADHRLTLQSGQVGAFLAALCLELRRQGLDLPIAANESYSKHNLDQRWLRTVADDLVQHRGHSLVLAGRHQPAEVHALAVAVNDALGNIGRTIVFKSNPHEMTSSLSDFRQLNTSIGNGEVDTLIILGGNPVYNAPADLDFAANLDSISNTIHLSSHFDETSRAVSWHIPRHHYLESWGDVADLDGHLGIIQPLIAPLYDGMSSVELLPLITGGEKKKGYDEVRTTWEGILSEKIGEKRWRKVLHDGIYEWVRPAAKGRVNHQAIDLRLAANPLHADQDEIDKLEIVFQLSPAVQDGRFANNGWLQELPDPVTKITWDNAALISKHTAEKLGLHHQELAYLSLNGRHLTIPVWIMPGQADNSVAVALGYGRQAAGRIGSGVGSNAYLLRDSNTTGFSAGLSIRGLGKTYALACVQDHHGLDAEELAAKGIRQRLPAIVREASLDEYRRHPEFAHERVGHPPLKSMWKEHRYDEGYQWGMVVDLNACIGCGACTVACQSENNIPVVGKKQVLNGREMHWMRIDRYYSGSIEDPAVVTQPVACVHCEMAPCESVCPVAATTHDQEGLNTMAYNRCVGTRYCSNNCPYKVRRFNFFNHTRDLPEIVRLLQNPDVTVRSRGVMEKCTYCIQRINRGKRNAKNKGLEVMDGEIVTACQEACPTQAISFGNINDPASEVAVNKSSNRNYDLLGELNVRPRTSYLAKLRNPNPKLEKDS
ncbi:TAT-variant-translocated molybdopterin oxidoreductase [Candidatus Neomarinimicrobiota bacterium]